MRRTSLALLVGFVTALTGAAEAQTLDLGRGELPLHVPSSYEAGSPAPLVVLLHGYGGTGEGVANYMRFSTLVDRYGFVLVSPNGSQETTGSDARFWNASSACCNFGGSTVDDSGYVLAIIDDLKSRYSIDAKRVYLVGHSNGGFMTYRAAYDHPNTIAAIASLAGAAASEDRVPPASPVHVLQIHGTDDSTIAYAGGDIQGTPYPSAVESVERWASYGGCTGEPRVQDHALDLDEEIPGPETTASRYVGGCRAGGSSELWTIAGGRHAPALSETFSSNLIEWLLAHPKP